MAHQTTTLIGSVWQWQYGEFSPVDNWSPAINVYRIEDRVEICVDLAGVSRDRLDVHVEPGRLTIRGVRHPPEPPRQEGKELRILCMEIDHGSFSREVGLPDDVDTKRAESEYRDGLLWVRLPLRKRRR